MAEPQCRYTVSSTKMSAPEWDSELPGALGRPPAGPVVKGYGAELVDQVHRPLEDGAAIIHLPRDTQYVLRLSNANNHLVQVKVEIDEVHVGTLLLNPYTFCDLGRPLDRPLAFTFCQSVEEPQEEKTDPKTKNKGKRNSAAPTTATTRWRNAMPTFAARVNLRTMIKCTFQPAAGARTMEVDIRAHAADIVKRYELAQDLSVADLFTDLASDFGAPANEKACALLHWTNAEYDSPVEEVLTPDLQIPLGNSLRKDDPLRKMSLVSARKLEIRDEQGNEVILDLTKVPRFADVMESVQKDFAVGGHGNDVTKEKPLYFVTRGGRVLGSSAWISRQCYIFEVLHKDELLESLPSLQIDVTSKLPKGIYTVFVRVLKGGMYELQATKDTSLRELRLQLIARASLSGDDPCWLFCGTLLDASKPLSHYGIRPRDTLDILLRNHGDDDRTLRREDPIAVEGDVAISSAGLLRSPKCGSTALTERRLKWRGTTLMGRNTQQFMEVDPIATDERFYTGISLSLAPDDEELVSAGDRLETLGTPTGSGCNVM